MKKFSIITPTYNSGGTLRLYFESIIRQDYDLTKVEVLIIDGGSTDDTLEIAQEYKDKIAIRVIDNPSKLPEYAKARGVNEAVGEYCVFQDSDEALTNKDSLAIREQVFNENPKVRNIVCTVYKNPKGYSRWGEYTSLIGDPFTAFVYGFDADTHLNWAKKLYTTAVDNVHYRVFKLSPNDLQPLMDATGHTFHRQNLYNLDNVETLSTRQVSGISQVMVSASRCFAVTKNDEVLHYTSSSFNKIIRKIDSRIIRNVYGAKDAGFIARITTMPTRYKYKKYAFLPYAFLILPALYDSFRFAIKTKNICFLAHVIFANYAAYSICWNTILCFLGVKKKIERYG